MEIKKRIFEIDAYNIMQDYFSFENHIDQGAFNDKDLELEIKKACIKAFQEYYPGGPTNEELKMLYKHASWIVEITN